jgi:hypothetical protein
MGNIFGQKKEATRRGMKELVLNMVCRLKTDSCEALVRMKSSDSGKALVRVNSCESWNTSPIPLFFRDVGKYYWNRKQIVSEYKIIPETCIENGYIKMFRFFDAHKLLGLASRHGHLEVVKYLVEHGADIHAEDDYALVLACRKGHFEIVKYLHREWFPRERVLARAHRRKTENRTCPDSR